MKRTLKKWTAALRREFWYFLTLVIVLAGMVSALWFSYKEKKVREDLFGILGLFVALVAMILALRDAKQQRKEADRIARSMSTQYIGEFPHHVEQIVRVVSHVRKNLRFMADCVDYSSFSYPEGHRQLHDAILKAKDEGRTIQILVWEKPEAITHSSPLHYEENFETLKKTSEYTEFFERYKHYEEHKPTSLEELKALLLLRERHFEEELLSLNEKMRKQNVEIKTLPNAKMAASGLFMWLADDQYAVFLLLAKDAKSSRVAFHTRDTNIINSLISIFDSKFKEARMKTS